MKKKKKRQKNGGKKEKNNKFKQPSHSKHCCNKEVITVRNETIACKVAMCGPILSKIAKRIHPSK